MSNLNVSNDSLGKQTTAFIDIGDDVTSATNEHIEAAVRQYRRQLCDEFKNNITLHGFRQLSTEKGRRKIFWILSMTILTVFAVYLSYHMLRDFGYRTALEYEYEEGLSHLDMPTITICGTNPVSSPNSFKKFPLNITLEEFKTFYKEMLYVDSYSTTPSNASKAILQDLYLINITSYKEIRQLFEATIHDSMDTFPKSVCYQGGSQCNLTTDFRETSTIWGGSLCHQWNYYHDEKKVSKQKTMESGIWMLLDVHADYQLTLGYFFHSVDLYIHPYGTPHYLNQYTEVIGLQTGKSNTINIELTERNLLPSPYSTNCGKKKLSIIKNFPYSKTLCEIDCILAKIYKKCKCISFEFEGYIGDVPICSVEQMKCYYKQTITYQYSCVNYASTCPRECTYYQYRLQTSRVQDITGKVMYHYVFNGSTKGWTKDLEETKKYINRNIVGFHIGYKSLSKKVENYVPLVSPSGLIGTLGGSIGLCLGFSFVTAFEIIVFIYDYATARWKVKARK